METILKMESSAIINLFRKMTNEQLGKILRGYLNNNPRDLTEDENKIYAEFVKHRDKQKTIHKDRTLKGWETRRKNGTVSSKAVNNKLQAQIQRDKEEMIKLRTENETLKKSTKQQYNNWNNKSKQQMTREEIEEELKKNPDMEKTYW